jgi:hypothetical protein
MWRTGIQEKVRSLRLQTPLNSESYQSNTDCDRSSFSFSKNKVVSCCGLIGDLIGCSSIQSAELLLLLERSVVIASNLTLQSHQLILPVTALVNGIEIFTVQLEAVLHLQFDAFSQSIE